MPPPLMARAKQPSVTASTLVTVRKRPPERKAPPLSSSNAATLAALRAGDRQPGTDSSPTELQDKVGNGAVAAGLKRGPDQDPKFAALKKDVATKKHMVATSHPPPRTESASAQNAAQPPKDDEVAQGKTANAEKMNDAKPKEFDKAAFIKAVEKAIADKAPKNLDDADKFADSDKPKEIKDEVQNRVGEGKTDSAEQISTTTDAPPDTSAAVTKKVVPMAADRPPGTPTTPDPAKATPDTLPQSATDMSAGPASVSQKMADAQITEPQLRKSNEPAFNNALNNKKAAEQHSDAAPSKLRKNEAAQLHQTTAQAKQLGTTAMGAIAAQRVHAGQQVGTGKKGAKSRDEDKRAQVTATLQKVFDTMKTDVDGILKGLDKLVDDQFTRGEKAARDAFTAEHKQKMDEYKSRRYSGWSGKWRWVHDKFLGMPDEANQIFVVARDHYVTRMRQVISDVADTIGRELTRAKQRIAAGRTELQNEVRKLPADLQAIGKEAAAGFADRFDELTTSVDDKSTSLVDTLATKYTDAVKSVDTEIAVEREKNQGLVNKAINAVEGVIDTIRELKNLLLGVLAKAAQAVMGIIRDPIGFLSNLISAVGGGLKLFMKNALTHLQQGVMAWLLGTAATAGLQLPTTFDVLGILLMIASLLGLTWANVRARLVRKVPEKAVAAAETAVPLVMEVRKRGIAGMWAELKTRIGDLKKDLISNLVSFLLPTIIIAGITWIVSLFNPASAFIRACKMIIDIIRFIVTQGRQIIEFVNTVLDAVIAIAKGGTGGVPALVEKALARSIPVLIGALTSILGIGGIASKVKEIFQKLARPVNKAIDWVVDKITGLIKKLWARLKALGKKVKDKFKAAGKKVKDKFAKRKQDDRTEEQQLHDLNAGLDAADALLRKKLPRPEVEKLLPQIKQAHKLTELNLVADDRRGTDAIVHIKGRVNPSGTRPQRPIPGLFESIDPSEKSRESFTFKGDEQVSRSGSTEVSLTTKIIYREGNNKKGEGKILNSFDIVSFELILKEHFLDEIPSEKRWITAPDVPLVPGKGTRLVTYVNLRQLRRFEKYAGDQAVKEVRAELRRQGLPTILDPAEEARIRKGKSLYGTIKHVKLDNVENIQALLQLNRALNLHTGIDVNQAIMSTSSIPYVSEILAQTGGHIKSAVVIGARRQPVGLLMQYYEGIAPNRLRASVRARHEQLLTDYGVTRRTSILMNFDVGLEIEPFTQGTA